MLYHGVPASLANSSGIFLGDAAHFDLARPGAALYGVNPTPGRANPDAQRGRTDRAHPAMRKVRQGETVGYGATWTARRASRIAMVALGYADGLLRAASSSDGKNGGAAIIAGKRCPFVGRISMDLACIDVTDLPDGPAPTATCDINWRRITIDDVAASAGTIGLRDLTRLGPRCHRVYRGVVT